MSAHDWLEVFLLFAGTVLAVTGWLISAKVSRMDLDIDNQYPTHSDIKEMFQDFKQYLDERFNHMEQLTKRNSSAGDETGVYHNYKG